MSTFNETTERAETARELRRLLFMMMGLDPEHLRPGVDAKIFTGNGMVVLNHEAAERLVSALRRLPVAAAVEMRLDREA